jgi:hypothetical protein
MWEQQPRNSDGTQLQKNSEKHMDMLRVDYEKYLSYLI